jgi:hypothetical protein
LYFSFNFGANLHIIILTEAGAKNPAFPEKIAKSIMKVVNRCRCFRGYF